MYRFFFKRLFDISLSLIALLVLSPLMLIIYLFVRTKLGKPAIFKQNRPGKDEKVFSMFKFRTMTDGKDSKGNLLSDELRLTKFGKFLRSTSLDELPELINILKGEMSIVGPRPLLVKYLPLYSSEQKKRHLVRPGLTGLAQISGRNAISWDEKFELDIMYVEKVTFLRDLQIIILTIKKVITRDGIAANNNATIDEFKG